MLIEKYKRTRFYGLYDDNGTLVCVTVYKCGAQAVADRFDELERQFEKVNPEDLLTQQPGIYKVI